MIYILFYFEINKAIGSYVYHHLQQTVPNKLGVCGAANAAPSTEEIRQQLE
jgi:hypothetical protein